MSTPSTPSTGVNRRTAFVATAVVVGLIGSGALVWRSTSAAFTSQTSSGNNSWTSGSVGLSNDGSAGAVFNVAGLLPGDTGSRCIEVTYSGAVTTPVEFYVPTLTDADDLGASLDLVITPGTGAGADCSSFVSGGAALYTGTLKALAAANHDYASGLTSWSPTGAGQKKVYEIAYTLSTGTPNNKQGKTATVTFQWETQAGS